MPRLPRPFSLLRRFARNREGATAIEFGIVAIPMMMLVMGTVELGMVLLVTSTLDTATEFASRDMRTGVFQTTTNKQADIFKGKVCRNMTWLEGMCQGSLQVNAETFATFAEAKSPTMGDPKNWDPNNPTCWSVGNPGDIQLVRLEMNWPLFTPLLDSSLANVGSNVRRISTTKVFLNEPFNTDEPVKKKCK